MDLIEITKLIHALPVSETDLVDYYVKRRQQLVDEINNKLGQSFTLVELLAVAYETKINRS